MWVHSLALSSDAVGRQIGPYRIEALLGEGATAQVYRARHVDLGRVSALKLFAPNVAKGGVARERFIREATALERVRHPHVVRLYDFGVTDDGRPYLVLEWVDGTTLDAALGAQRETGRALGFLAQVARGLSAIHDAGVVHRDLKPANVMVTPGEPEVAKIVDFGIVAGESFDRLTAVDALVGTPRYMAPEQIEKAPIGPGTDLYALGAMAYEILAGQPHVDAGSLTEMLVNQMTVVPASLEPSHGPLGALIDRMLAKQLDDRPTSAADVAKVFEVSGGAPTASELPAQSEAPTSPHRPATPDAVHPKDLTASDHAGTPEPRPLPTAPMATIDAPAAQSSSLVLPIAGMLGSGVAIAIVVLLIFAPTEPPPPKPAPQKPAKSAPPAIRAEAREVPIAPAPPPVAARDAGTKRKKPVRANPVSKPAPTPAPTPPVEPPPPSPPPAPDAAALRQHLARVRKQAMAAIPNMSRADGIAADRRLIDLTTAVGNAKSEEERRDVARRLTSFERRLSKLGSPRR